MPSAVAGPSHSPSDSWASLGQVSLNLLSNLSSFCLEAFLDQRRRRPIAMQGEGDAKILLDTTTQQSKESTRALYTKTDTQKWLRSRKAGRGLRPRPVGFIDIEQRLAPRALLRIRIGRVSIICPWTTCSKALSRCRCMFSCASAAPVLPFCS